MKQVLQPFLQVSAPTQDHLTALVTILTGGVRLKTQQAVHIPEVCASMTAVYTATSSQYLKGFQCVALKTEYAQTHAKRPKQIVPININ